MSAPLEVIERHFAAFAAKDADAEPYSANAEVMAPGAQVRGRDQAFPDARLEAVQAIASGRHVAREGKIVGTHTGVLRTPDGEVPPTGRAVELRWMAMYEVAGEEILFEHLYFDSADFLMQLGLSG